MIAHALRSDYTPPPVPDHTGFVALCLVVPAVLAVAGFVLWRVNVHADRHPYDPRARLGMKLLVHHGPERRQKVRA